MCSTALTGQHNTQSVFPSVLSHMLIVPSKMKIICNCCLLLTAEYFFFSPFDLRGQNPVSIAVLDFPLDFIFRCCLMCFFYGVCSHLPEKQNRGRCLYGHSAQVVVVAQKRHTHTHQRQFLFNLKFMHSFIEQLYKILLIVASACLICQQIWSLNYKKQGFMSCSELLGHLSSS